MPEEVEPETADHAALLVLPPEEAGGQVRQQEVEAMVKGAQAAGQLAAQQRKSIGVVSGAPRVCLAQGP